MLNKVRQACRPLIRPGEQITCAVSGGPDSMALLWSLYRLRRELQISLAVLHCNHHLRGEASEQDAIFVAEFCQQYAIPCQIFDLDVAAQQASTGQSLEDAARQLRYACFSQVSGKVAVAHNAEDNLETSLIHLVRGTSPRGLSGIPARRDHIIRPLLSVPRAQILAFLDDEGVPCRLDESNQQDFCLRNRLRHHVLPHLTAENPRLAETWLDTAQQLRREDEYLSELARQAIEQVQAGQGFSITRLYTLHPVLQRRVLFGYLQRFGVEQPQLKHLQALEALLQSDHPSGTLDLPGCRIMRSYDMICPAAEPGTFAPVILPIPGTVQIPELELKITCNYLKKGEFPTNTPIIFTINCAMISNGPLTVRPRRPGDTLHLSGGSRSLKKLMIDRKIPCNLRQQVPVIADGNTILAVAGIGVDQTCKAQNAEGNLQIRIEKEA